jgi:hypothetical protein
VQAATFLLFDPLCIDQLRTGFQHGFAGPAAFARARKLFGCGSFRTTIERG